MARLDGRSDTQIRAMDASQGALALADAAARFSFGDTASICSINGPLEARIREERLERATIEATYRPAKGVPGVRAREVELAVQNIVDASLLSGWHPRTLVQVAVQCLNDGGSSLAASLNATSLALLDSGLPLHALPAAVTCAVMPAGQMLIDPTADEEETALSLHTIAFNTQHEEPVFVESFGSFTEEQLSDCYTLCRAGAVKVHAFYRLVRKQKLVEDGIGA